MKTGIDKPGILAGRRSSPAAKGTGTALRAAPAKPYSASGRSMIRRRQAELRAFAAGGCAGGNSSGMPQRPAPLVIIGGGGHGRVVADMAEASGMYRIVAVLDDKYAAASRQNKRFIGPLSMIYALLGANRAMKAVVAIGDNMTRRLLTERLGLPAEKYAAIAHKGAHISKGAVIGCGTVVMPGAIVNVGARIGEHAIVNSGAVVEHDAVVGSFAHLSPRAAIAGGVRIGEGAHIGIGAAAIPSVSIGAWSVLGAGGTAVRDIPARAVAVGVPARIIRQAGGSEGRQHAYRQQMGEKNDAS